MRRLANLITLFIGAIVLFIQCKEAKTLVFIGSYTDGKPAKGLKVYDLDMKAGTTQLLSEVDDIINPSFIRLSENGKFLFVASESQLATNGFISSYAIDSQSGTLKFLNRQSTLGRNPVHVEIATEQNALVVSNYTDPSVSYYELNSRGLISKPKQHLVFQDSSIVKGRQDQAHIHSSSFSTEGKYLFAHDLGGDKIRTFHVKDSLSDASISDIMISRGSGPRHFTFDNDGKYAYLLSELGGSLTAFTYNNQSGKLDEIGKYATYGQKQDIYRAADIHMHPILDVLYVSNRGPEENTIVAFKKLSDGELEFLQRTSTEGEHPRNFAIDPSGNYIIIANQFTDNVVIKKLNPKTGLVEGISSEIIFDNPSTIQVYSY